MKNIEFYEPKKYEDSSKYEKVAEHIYRTEDTFLGGDMYVTSLKFKQSLMKAIRQVISHSIRWKTFWTSIL